MFFQGVSTGKVSPFDKTALKCGGFTFCFFSLKLCYLVRELSFSAERSPYFELIETPQKQTFVCYCRCLLRREKNCVDSALSLV